MHTCLRNICDLINFCIANRFPVEKISPGMVNFILYSIVDIDRFYEFVLFQ